MTRTGNGHVADDPATLDLPAGPDGPATLPVGVATFAGDVFQSVRRLAERDHPAITGWHSYPGGGHHPVHQVPATLAADIRAFFAGKR